MPSQFGDFLYRVQAVEVAEQVLSDYNLLFFLAERRFFGAFSAEQNLFTNRPLELCSWRSVRARRRRPCRWSSRGPIRRIATSATSQIASATWDSAA